MAAAITNAGASLIAQKQATGEVLVVTRFVLALVPDLDTAGPVDRDTTFPPAQQIVCTEPYSQKGFVNPNQVVYSLMLGSDIGDFDWNWIGLETEEGVLLSVAYVPVQQKRKNTPPHQIGNNVTRNFMVKFDGAQSLTAITVDASTWQHDFTVRLHDIDDRERLSNRDVFGRACFFGNSFQLVVVAGAYHLSHGPAFLEGIRVELGAVLPVVPPALPTTAWLDVALARQDSSAGAVFSVVWGDALTDYADSAGVQHYLIPLADVQDSVTIIDRRVVEPIDSPLVTHFAARVGTYPHLRAQATTKADVGLDQVPNAISNDSDSNDPWILATTRMVQAVRAHLYAGIKALMDGTTAAGKAKQLETAREISISGAGTGAVSFDGTKDVQLALTLANSGVQPGTYTKVTLNAKGLVTYGGGLHAVDIPSLSWISHIVDKPTTADGYGLTDVLVVGKPSAQRPILLSNVGGPDWTYSALEIRECGLVANTQSHYEFAPRIAFHWGAVTAGALGMASNGELCWNGQRLWTAGNFEPATVVPAGAVIAFAFGHTPEGYLRANGAAVSRAAYPRLFAVIGGHYGAGDGHSTFNLPDMRGLFVRGLDEGRGVDAGRGLGSFQDSQNLWHGHTASSDMQGEHTHGILKAASGNNTSGGYVSPANVGNTLANTQPAGTHHHNITVDGSGGHESRPVNIAFPYCIKY